MTGLEPPTTLHRSGPTASTVRPPLAPLTAERVFIGRSIRHTLRNGEALVMAIVLPTMMMLLFTFVFGGAIDPSGGYVDFVVPGIILTCAGFGASYTALAVNADMTTGIIDRFRTMPLPATAVLTGHVVASLLKNLLATAIVIGVAVAIGFRPSATALHWLAVLGIVAFWILAITALFAAIGLAASSADAASGYGFILLFLPYLSSAFVPIDTLPEWLQPIAANQPISPIVDTIRGLLFGTPIGDSWLWALGWCTLVVGVATVWGGWLFGRRAGRR